MAYSATRCPQCKTTFRVSDAQLRAADGMVRCGACLEVFQAESVIPVPSEPAPAVNPQPGKRPVSPAGDAEVSARSSAVAPEPVSASETEVFPDFAAVRTSAQELDFSDENDLPPISRENLSFVRNISDTLQLELPEQRRLYLNIAAGFGICLLSLSLGLQTIWHNRHGLSQDPDRRAWAEAGCRLMPCNLQPLNDINSVRASNLQITSHPDTEGALQFSMNFSNEANFAQPFPLLELIFSDQTQQPVAARRFTPHEYLDAQLRHMTLMPASSSVQVSLDIVDPGEHAINYEVVFRHE